MVRYRCIKGTDTNNACNIFYGKMKSNLQNIAVHYCTIQTLDAILKEGFLRAVDSRFMNDLGEYEFGINVIKNKFDKIIESNVIPVTVSFSCEPDLTTQWAMYAKELGVGIEMDFGFSSYWRDAKNDKTIITIDDFPPEIAQEGRNNKFITVGTSYPLKVIYYDDKGESTDESINQLKKAINDAHENVGRIKNYTPPKFDDIYQFASTFIKSKAFEYEKEARISTFIMDELNSISPKIYFHANSCYLRPYVNLCFIRENTNGIENIGWPIKTIWVGPGRNQIKAVESVIKRLELGDVKCFPVPFEEFEKRLEEYIADMYTYVGIKADKAKKYTNDILSEVFTNNMKYKQNGTQKSHKCLDFDEYKTAQMIINDAIKKAKGNIVKYYIEEYSAVYTESYVKDKAKEQAAKLVNEFESYNYFSYYGIRIKSSQKPFSFV